MPEIPGMKISISTTLGLAAGITRKASSPVGHAATHLKLLNDSSSLIQCSRVAFSSSTRANVQTEMALGLSAISDTGILIWILIGRIRSLRMHFCLKEALVYRCGLQPFSWTTY